MKILTRYILREHLGPLVFALSALTFLLLLNQVAKQFGSLVGKGLSWGVIGEFFLLSIPFILAMTLPMAVLVAVLYAFSRMASENEVTALRANGVSLVRLVRPVLAGGAVLALLMLAFNDQVLPRSNHRLRTLQTDIARKKPTFGIREQVLNEVVPGKLYLRADHIDAASDNLRGVTIYNFDDPTRRKTIYADSGRMKLTPDQRDLEMTLHTGWMQEVPRDNLAEFQRLYYLTDVVRVRGVGNAFEETSTDTYKSEREMSICEMNAQYQDGAHQLEVARADLANALGAAAHYAATGEVLPVPPTPRKRERLTSGSLFCRVVGALAGGVPEAAAAELTTRQDTSHRARPATARARPYTLQGRLPAQRQPLPQPPAGGGMIRPRPGTGVVAPSSGRAPAIAPSAGGASRALAMPQGPGRMPYGTTPALIGNVAQLQVLQARVIDARISMSRYSVEIQKKFALAAACMVFVLLGAPIALRFPRGGVGLVIGVSISAFTIYYVGLVAGESLAEKLILSPVTAMWMANELFTLIGVVLLARAQRYGATARGGDVGEALDMARAWLARRLRPLGFTADRRRRLA